MGDYGVVFRRGDERHLQEVLQHLCDTPQLVNQYKEKAADYICGRYNWDDVTAQTLRLYGVDDK